MSKFFPRLLQSNAAYIGLIGSKRRWEITKKTLTEEYGIDKSDIERINAPIGIEIEAETPTRNCD